MGRDRKAEDAMMGPLRCYCILAIAGTLLTIQVRRVRTFAVDSETALKELLLKNMTEKEIHHFFGDLPEPVFHLVRPRFLPHSSPDLPREVRFIIRSPDLSVNSVLASADILAPHLTGVTIGGEHVDLQPANACHFRASNVSHVISINNCSHNSLDGIIITPEQLATLHPLPQRFVLLVEQHLPCISIDLDDEQSTDDISKGKVYGVHIFHVARREDLPVSGRKKREADEKQEETLVCATGPEHDMSRHLDTIEHTHTRPHYIRNLNEIVSDSDLGRTQQVQSDFHDDAESHNHTVVAQPVMVVTKKTVELAVFGDKDLYNNFPENIDNADKSRMVNYILTLINAVQGIYHQEELQGFVIDIRVVRLDIHTSNEGPSSGGGDIGAYLTSFCSWQQPQNPQGDGNPEHWDHSIMLSGLDLHSSGNPSVIGLAWVGGMCRPSISCTMNEGRSFMSVYVVAHEMGHNLGMNHDGQGDAQQCSSSKYIMSPSVGPGKTTWSSCSIRVIHSFLQKSSCLDDGEQGRAIATTGRAANTLSSDHHDGMSPRQYMSEATVDLQAILHRTPGYQFALPDQCKAMFGRDYYPALTKFDLCDYLYCTNGVVTKPAHPALEGSFCGSHRVCIAGKCRPEEELARLILYNIPSIPHGGGTASPAIVSPSSLTTASSTQSLKTSTEEPYTTPTDATISSPVLPVMTPDNCFCNVTTNTPHSLQNMPREICPFIAPVYHSLFSCATECSEYDLYIDLSSGNVTKVPTEMTQLEMAAESCFIGSYTIISDKKTEMLSEAVLKDLRDPIKDPSICQALPHLLHPALQCPSINPLGLEKECMPQEIIVKMAEHNYTYVLEKHEGNMAKALHWKGNNYTLLRNVESDGDEKEARTLFAPLTGQNEKDSQFSFIKCDLEAKFPKELENLPKAICKFLAPSLHNLFNCSMDNKCLEYVLFINLLNNNVTKVPVKTPFEQELPCTVCQQQEQITSSVVFDIIQAIINMTLEPDNLCKLLPSSWQAWIPSCTTEAVRASVSEDTCPPIKIVIQADDTSFTYTSDLGDKHIMSQPMIEWRGHSYVLEKITNNKEIMAILEEEYDLDFDAQVSRKSLSHELAVMPLSESSVSPGRELTANGKFDSHSGLSIEDTSQSTSPRTLFGALPNQPLQEYVGQNDIFLPLNAPKAMPRTKVGACSVSCGVGMRLVQMECVDVMTNQVVDDDSCQGYLIPTQQLEACHMPQCQPPRWSISDWGTCSETCGAGIQYRRVECAIQIDQDKGELQGNENNNLLTQANLVVDDQQCEGQPPHRYRDCEGSCLPAPWCEDAEDCFSYVDVQISKDFDY